MLGDPELVELATLVRGPWHEGALVGVSQLTVPTRCRIALAVAQQWFSEWRASLDVENANNGER